MNKATAVYLNAMGLKCAQTANSQALMDRFLQPSPLPVEPINCSLPYIEGRQFDKTRNNQVALAALLQINEQVLASIQLFGPHRIGVIIGTSTSGIAETEKCLKALHHKDASLKNLSLPYHYSMQEMGAPAEFIRHYYNLSGPCYGISTACTSGAKALATARRLIRSGFCDAVIAGGVDTLCELTLQGFASLGALSDEICNPMSKNRKGINIGEAAAFFLVSKKPSGAKLLGIGESSDAYHISAPDPSGQGARLAMQSALADAQLDPSEIDYINLHGTATTLNDTMESKAVSSIFGDNTWCSSTKPYTGHTLGAAGALEAAICWELLTNTTHPLPPHQWDGIIDDQIAPLKLVPQNTHTRRSTISEQATAPEQATALNSHKSTEYGPQRMMSNSFAFGGNNISLILESADATQ